MPWRWIKRPNKDGEKNDAEKAKDVKEEETGADGDKDVSKDLEKLAKLSLNIPSF